MSRSMECTRVQSACVHNNLIACSCTVAIGQNQPLVHEQEEWTSEMPLTEGQLRGKRDTFWETAPVYEGSKEIWDALRAACEAVEDEDYELAQAIVDGASVSLPRGMMGCVVNAGCENKMAVSCVHVRQKIVHLCLR